MATSKELTPRFASAQKPRTYEAFFHAFSGLYRGMGGINIVKASNRAKPGKKVVTGNHETLADPFLFGLVSNDEALHSLGKEQLTTWRYLYVGRWALGPLMNTTFIKRSGEDYDLLDDVADFMMARNAAILSYLFGTRRADEKGLRPKTGTAHMAIRSSTEDSPTPIVVYGHSLSVWRPGTPIQVVEGCPIYAPSSGRELSGAELRRERRRLTSDVAGSMASLKAQAIQLHKDGAGSRFRITRHG